jgi:type I restriction enzyme S subunit
MAKTLYDYWFTQFDFPDENGKPYRSSGGKMAWNELLKREIPNGWKVTTLNKICTFRNGINYNKEGNGDKLYRIVNVRNISASDILLNQHELDLIYLPQSQADRYQVTHTDILIARSGIPGATRILYEFSEPTIFCGFIICCTPMIQRYKMYLTYLLKRLEGTSATKTGGSILQNVSQDTLGDLLVCLPPDDILEKFNIAMEAVLNPMQNVLDENDHLSDLRDWLLPMLMNGQATISD